MHLVALGVRLGLPYGKRRGYAYGREIEVKVILNLYLVFKSLYPFMRLHDGPRHLVPKYLMVIL